MHRYRYRYRADTELNVLVLVKMMFLLRYQVCKQCLCLEKETLTTEGIMGIKKAVYEVNLSY